MWLLLLSRCWAPCWSSRLWRIPTWRCRWLRLCRARRSASASTPSCVNARFNCENWSATSFPNLSDIAQSKAIIIQLFFVCSNKRADRASWRCRRSRPTQTCRACSARDLSETWSVSVWPSLKWRTHAQATSSSCRRCATSTSGPLRSLSPQHVPFFSLEVTILHCFFITVVIFAVFSLAMLVCRCCVTTCPNCRCSTCAKHLLPTKV